MRRPVVIVGAGPVGLALAIDLAQRGVPVVRPRQRRHACRPARARSASPSARWRSSTASAAATAWSARACRWNVGKVFLQRRAGLPLRPAARGRPRAARVRQPAAVLRRGLPGRARGAAAADRPALEERASSASSRTTTTSTLTIDTPDGAYALEARLRRRLRRRRSAVRRHLGLESKGRTFRDRFLIADVKMRHDSPAERWFWFDPPFHPQPERAAAPPARRRVAHRLPARLGRRPRRGEAARAHHSARARRCWRRRERTPNSSSNGSASTRSRACAWTASATAACCSRATRRTACRRSARAARTRGVQDADNLALEARRGAARAARPTRCSTPTPASAKTPPTRTSSTRRAPPTSSRPRARSSRLFRDAVLKLARTQPFARTLVNSGRLSMPATLRDSPLNTPDARALRRRDGAGRAPRPTRPSRARTAATTGCCASWATASPRWSAPTPRVERAARHRRRRLRAEGPRDRARRPRRAALSTATAPSRAATTCNRHRRAAAPRRARLRALAHAHARAGRGRDAARAARP